MADAAERRTHVIGADETGADETEIYAPVAIFEDRTIKNALVALPAAGAGNVHVNGPPVRSPSIRRPRGDVPVAPDLLA